MLDSLWESVTETGVNPNEHWQKNLHIILCNKISIILFLLALILSSVAAAYFGFIAPVTIGYGVSFIFVVPILLNRYNLYDFSRVFLASSISLSAVGISVIDKFDVPVSLEEFQYIHMRFILLPAGILPLLLFRLEEKVQLLLTMTINILCLIFFDPIHELFGVGYYQMGFIGANYSFMNFISLGSYLILGGSTFFLKFSYERYEKKNETLIKNLNTANRLINQQQELLSKENIQLSKDLVEKNSQLYLSNQELIRQNNNLMQFSHTISHNLRGPVASLIGLMRLFNTEKFEEENRTVLSHIQLSLASLDGVIKDLNTIIDSRNNVSHIKQKIFFENEIESIKSLMHKQIDDYAILIETNFTEIPSMISIKPIVTSILYNLISNSIKYRSLDRSTEIKISSSKQNEFIVISIADNGLGIDIEKNKDKLFNLYSRFHTHTDGKGIGLFLVKQQVEMLEGKVDVVSTLGQGTTFTVYLKE